MANSFVERLEEQHTHFVDAFEDYRNQLTDVLFYGERISRSELTEGKENFIRGLRDQMDAVKNVLLPAVTNSENEKSVKGVELFADVQETLLEIANRTEEDIDFFANPDAPKEERNDAAREILKNLYRLDSALLLYFRLLENHLLPLGDQELEEDEKEEILEPLRGYDEDD